MSAAAVATIAAACKAASEAGVAIRRGATFCWAPTGEVTTCCALGAVLWHAGLATPSLSVTAAAELLGVNRFWIYRFVFGFDQGRPMLVDFGDKQERPVWREDEVSAAGARMAREWAT